MTELEHDNIVRYIGCDLNMTKKEVTLHAASLSSKVTIIPVIQIRMYMELYSGTLRDVMDSRSQVGKQVIFKNVAMFCHSENRHLCETAQQKAYKERDHCLFLSDSEGTPLPTFKEYHSPRS